MDLGSRYLGALAHISRREVLFRFEAVNIEILQHLFVVKHLDCNRCGIDIRYYMMICDEGYCLS
jgi:hypothetical protein